MLLAAVAVVVAAAPAGDPCALRALAREPSAALLARVDKAEGRARACLSVVAANALSREGHGSDAVRLYREAAAALPEIASFLDIAERRALAPPPRPGGVDEGPPPKTADEAAARVSTLLRAAKPRRAAQVALAFAPQPPRPDELSVVDAAASDPATITPPAAGDAAAGDGEVAHPPREAFEVAAVTALVRAGRVDEALARAAKLPARDALMKVRAWALAKARRFDDARDLYTQLAARTKDPALKAEASFYAGFSSYEAGALDDAKARFVAGADVMRGTPFEPFGRWYAALCDLLRSKWSDAVPILDGLVRDLPGDREVLKHRYWLGRALVGAGRTREGNKELAAVAAVDPVGYYGLLARARLHRKPLHGARVAPDALADKAPDDEDAKKVHLLWGVGLDDEARTLARGLGEGAPQIALQQSVDDAHFGWRRGARFIPSPRARRGALVADPRWRVSYAAPWHHDVVAAAKKYGVSAALLYAIMRTESGFDPRAVSVAGARGLLQLLPSVARGSCGLAGRPADDAARIFEPLVAIDLSAALLAAERREFGSDALAAAVYNGSAPNVVRWMTAHRTLEPELFVERIPFRETRDYVKRVLSVEAVYRALDGAPLSLEMPASIPAPPARFTSFPTDE